VQREGIQSTGPAAASTLYSPPADVLASVMAATKALNIYSNNHTPTSALAAPASRAPSVPRKRQREGRSNAAPAGIKKRSIGTDGHGFPAYQITPSGITTDLHSSRLASATPNGAGELHNIADLLLGTSQHPPCRHPALFSGCSNPRNARAHRILRSCSITG
jgi:hypothetical protein